MSDYLFIETQDPFGSHDARFVTETAIPLKASGHHVAVFLVQNGVLAVRRTNSDDSLERLLATNIEIAADDFSLAERGIVPDEMRPGVEISNIDNLVDRLVGGGTKVIWH